MIANPSFAALIWLVAGVPIAIWVAWNDMAHMKIPNQAVMALLVVFAVTGPFLLPLAEYGWRWVHVVVVLAIGFALNMAGAMGAGDAKFAMAMAPFFATADAVFGLYLMAGFLLAAFVAHRLMRSIPAFRNAVPDWKSWDNPKFPAGLALGGVLIAYLTLSALYGR